MCAADVIDNWLLGRKFANGMGTSFIIACVVFSLVAAALCEVAADGVHSPAQNLRVGMQFWVFALTAVGRQQRLVRVWVICIDEAIVPWSYRVHIRGISRRGGVVFVGRIHISDQVADGVHADNVTRYINLSFVGNSAGGRCGLDRTSKTGRSPSRVV